MTNTTVKAPTNWTPEITEATVEKFAELGGERENLAEVREWVNETYGWTKSDVAIRTKLSSAGVWKNKEATTTAVKSGAVQKVSLQTSLAQTTGIELETAVKMNKTELQALLAWAEAQTKAETSES